MTKLVSKFLILPLAFVFLFMTNVSIWDEHSNWLLKELEQHSHVEQQEWADEYIVLHDIESVAKPQVHDSLSIEHELLHAASHLPLYWGEEAFDFRLPLAESKKHVLYSTVVAFTSTKPPLRPPRITI
ncbi:hypothetical protein [Oxalicibacterium faecigallinarum]|uniref:hypothetical protein n=1 Tax=Oxalicibacterium faecigallinarum TaxID=573741 RepID=UPI001667C4EB|nr:hypothetical protein [Oxalicibacterium faecigallinarum]